MQNILKENLEKLGKYTDYVVSSINENKDELEKEVKEETINETQTTEVIESEVVNETFKNELSDKISALVESAKKQKVEETSANTHFLNFLDESRREEFKSFDEESKAQVIRAYESESWFGSTDASGIWESVFTEPEKTIDWLESRPEKYNALWESLNEGSKNAIKAQASARNLDTQYKIDHFWATRELRGSNPSEQINESEKIQEGKETESSEYQTSSVYMDTVSRGA